MRSPLECAIEFLNLGKRIGVLAVNQEQRGNVLAVSAGPDRATAVGSGDFLAVERDLDPIRRLAVPRHSPLTVAPWMRKLLHA